VLVKSDHWFVLGSAALASALREGLPALVNAGMEGKSSD
jgi:hypothetical protein